MTGTTDAQKRFGFLARLRKDQAGNTLALFAAAIFPMIGLVGGAIDISRVYAVKTRMQAACDAGSLAARKVMGNGTWTTASDAAGNRMFLSNFEPGFLGSDGIDVDFVEANGTVSGTAETVVPMALMQVLGIDDEQVSVTCTSEMKIPNTDVMFVLDVTGSMDQVIPGDPSGKKKIVGLRESVKCFYEALARENTTVSKETCKKPSDPVGDLSELTQLRFGFVPFSSQINVGKLLPNGYFKDTQTFQSRFPNVQNVQTWTLGTESAKSWPGNWTPTGIPTNPYHTRQSTSGYTDVTVDTTTLQGLKTFQRTGTNADTESECEGSTHNNLASSGGQLTGLTEALGTPTAGTFQSATNDPPTHPNTQQVLTYNRTRNDIITQYRYNWENRGSGNRCYLERRAHTTPHVRQDNGGTSTKQINWTARQSITSWTYRPVAFNVAPLKAGGGNDASLNYNTSLPLPITQTSGSYNLSGSSTSTTLYLPANRNVSWNGCIEERQTVKNTDGNPFDEWGSVPTTPIAAWDMTVDMAPVTSNEETRWGFMLGEIPGSPGTGAVWPRATGVTFNGSGNVTGYTRQFGNYNRTPDQAEVTDARYQFSADNCPKEASRYRAYRDATGASQFETYVNALAPVGGTYQDIGLLWGARLMSPTGIFGASNATTPSGLPIQRHMIFMTDGVTDTSETSYTPYGLEYWDRRRTGDGLTPTETWLDDITKARIENLCTQIKNLGDEGVTVWVIYYGEQTLPNNAAQVDKDRLANTIARMKTCATQPSDKFFFPASSTDTLMDAFNKIADSISELKLTS